MATKGPTQGTVILMTRVVHRRLYPEFSAECGLYSSIEEDCAHLSLDDPLRDQYGINKLV